jgi:hypothetical protein
MKKTVYQSHSGKSNARIFVPADGAGLTDKGRSTSLEAIQNRHVYRYSSGHE